MKPAKPACVVAALRGVLMFAVVASTAGAQNPAWIRQLGMNYVDAAYGAATDEAGGVYIYGLMDGVGASSPPHFWSNAFIARYDTAGIQAWIRQLGNFGESFAYAAAPDGAGGVYVSGWTEGGLGGPNAGGYDAWLARYDSAGNQTWIRQLGTSVNNGATAAASDGAGGVYVSGATEGTLGGPSAGGYDAWLARYDSAGNQTWIRQLGTNVDDGAAAMAPDGAGGFYVSGWTEGGLGGPNAGGDDAWLARYDSGGNQIWIRQLGTITADDATAMAPDGAGGVFVGGSTTGSLGGPSAGSSDAWLARYDSAGQQTWIRQMGTSNNDQGTAVAIDGSGGIYACGSIFPGPTASDEDAWIAHFDAAGDQTWIRQLGTVAQDRAYASAPDGAGGVFVGGSTTGSLGGPNSGSVDAWLARFDPNPSTYCTPAAPNSTGQPGRINVIGSLAVTDNQLTLVASQVSLDSFGYFITSQTRGFVPGSGGSQGNLCLGGGVGRFVGPGQIRNSGAAGTFSLAIDLNAMPSPPSFVAAQPGETWNYQAWHRDANPTSTSNFTDAIAVTFH